MLASLSRVQASLRSVTLHSSLPSTFYGCLQSSQAIAQLHGQAGRQHEHTNKRGSWRYGNSTVAALIGGSFAAAVAYGISEENSLKTDAQPKLMDDELRKHFGVRKPGLPEYSLDDVAKHSTPQDRVWISFNNGVYDVTEFVSKHPGGDKILLGAGGSVEPFWTLYAVHKRADVLELLETFRIGNLREDDVGVSTENMDDPYAREPRRHVALKPASKTPFNAEPPPQLLVESLYTPNDLFYVRNHLPVPDMKESEYSLEVCGLGVQELQLTLDDIKKFPKHTISAAVQCGGNRRSEMVQVRPVKGLSWGPAAISNATWSGALLSDVLKAAGFNETDTRARHVQFEGLDLDPTSHPYGASIPLWKAVERSEEVLLAYEMNGQTLPRDHGYPLRVIVPGVVGARNVKWLGRIVVSEDESDSHWQQNDYKGFAPNVDWDTVDFSKSPAIQEMPVVSAICDPGPGEVLTPVDGKVTVRGYAYSGGGRKIVRVDISSDGGKSWRAVECLESDAAEHPRAWGWSLWTAHVEVPEGTKDLNLVVKAVDSNYNTQPENFENIWNLRGVLSNAYHRVSVKVK